jgi:hypothetical protein
MAGADSSSEELYDENNWVLYKDRVEWRDVTAVPQDDGPYPIVAISYSEKCEYIKPCRANTTAWSDPNRGASNVNNWNVENVGCIANFMNWSHVRNIQWI